jgi:DNA polymerase III delta prime subunit
MSNLENLVWAEKYRPSKISECILPPETMKMLTDVLASGEIPNFLFAGSAGTGKTTAARAIAAELGADLLFINASLDGNIETLRTTISQFVTSVSFSDSKKIVLLDESDYLNQNSTQPSLRGFIDQFSKNCIFILTCNYPERIISPLISRLTVVDFKFSKDEKQAGALGMHKRCLQILDKEEVKYEKQAVAAVVTKNFPDFRKTLVQLQRYSTSGIIDSGIVAGSEDTSIEDLFAHVKSKDFTKCRQWVANNSFDSSSFYRQVYTKSLQVLVPQTIPPVILSINQSQYEATSSVDQEINQMAFLINFMATAAFK